jgi:hypothetical protein
MAKTKIQNCLKVAETPVRMMSENKLSVITSAKGTLLRAQMKNRHIRVMISRLVRLVSWDQKCQYACLYEFISYLRVVGG